MRTCANLIIFLGKKKKNDDGFKEPNWANLILRSWGKLKSSKESRKIAGTSTKKQVMRREREREWGRAQNAREKVFIVKLLLGLILRKPPLKFISLSGKPFLQASPVESANFCSVENKQWLLFLSTHFFKYTFQQTFYLI